MKFTRRSGILFHPTSLAGTPGIGTLGKSAYQFADWLHEAHQTLWQMLPLGPTGYGDSPYASFSTFAGNPLLIDLDMLVEKGWALKDDIVPPDYIKTSGKIDFGSVVWWKLPLLSKCAAYFLTHCSEADRTAYETFKNDNAVWLDSYADFTSIKQYYDAEAQKQGISGIKGMWNAFWPRELASCSPAAVSEWDGSHTQNIEEIKVIQFFFDYQWSSLKKYVNSVGIDIIGDIPIFVAPDSADVWANQKFFQLNEYGVPVKVAGVPPDYFSATGQLWGNPLYDWNAMKADNYSWWIARIRRVLQLVDCLRIDHFRGFEAYWSIPYGDSTAVNGEWIKGPDIDLFNVIKKVLGDIPVIAEDLGLITDQVRSLRDGCGFPGMKVLQFAFDPDEAGKEGMSNAFLPHEYSTSHCIVYTGTHDNDTMQGWLERASDCAVQVVAEYVTGKELRKEDACSLVKSGELCDRMVQTAIASTADYAVIPMQDILRLDNSARMNVPSTTGTNWSWRMDGEALTKENASRLTFLSSMYGRNLK
ncbi:MAG: 4-alpha-glucanotransferase [Treponema sp.]|nr:4-alpha-glucanotransferase [Treponema sp.]